MSNDKWKMKTNYPGVQKESLTRQLADKHLNLHPRRCLRSLDCEISLGDASDVPRKCAAVETVEHGQEFAALFVWHPDLAKNLRGLGAPCQKFFGQSQPAKITRNQTDQH